MALYIVILCYFAMTSAQFIDELQEFNVECLGEGVFECIDGECILQDRFCDGNYDCKDGSDENFCLNHKPDEKYCNETHQFLCKDGSKCIPNKWVCNIDVDCEDKSDEINCTVSIAPANATCKGFQCDIVKCISKFWMCDGDYDCEDKSDEDIELTCRHALRPRELNNGLNCKSEVLGLYEKEYSCLDKSFCIPKDNMCDGMKDCKDGSDEGVFCDHWQTMCSNFTCNGTKCVPDRSGPYCDCLSPHYQYNYTAQRCDRIDNCLDDVPWCSHRCEKSGDGFKCSCDSGYAMDAVANYLCYAPAPEAMLFFSTHNDIRYLKVKSKEQRVIVSGIRQAHGVTYDGTFIYWVEIAQGHQAIVRAHFSNVEDTKEVLVAIGLEDPGDIAIDWLGGNLYFTDVQRGIIAVCKTDGSVCSVLHAKTKQPRFVTLDPRNGKMYWADWQDRALILTSRMDGTQPEILVDRMGELRPTGLALDSPNERLYFVDGTIKVVKLFDRKVYPLFQEPFHHPYSISVFENTVFWTDWTSETIQTADKMHGVDKRELLVKLREPVFDMHIYHPLLMQQTTNPCVNTGCSHICVPTSNITFSCLCPEGMQLFGKTCKQMPEYRPQFLIVGGGSLFTRIQYNVLGNPETHATHFDIGRVQAMAYDNSRDTLYVYDGHRKSINYINMSDFTLGLTRLLAYNGLDNVVDMGYDYVSDALYILDAGRHTIEVISLRTNYRTMIYRFSSQETPISFCILPDYGRLAVAVASSEIKKEIFIDSLGLDGDDRKHLLTNNILGPNIRLRYSPEMDIIYIADEGRGVIDFLHPEGTARERFREFTTSLATLEVTDTHVFWTDRYTEKIYWADVHKAGYKIRRMGLSIFPNNTLLHLQVTSLPLHDKNPLLKHACYQNSSLCSHICVQIPHPVPQDLDMGYKCLCPVGILLIDNTCVELASCKHNEHYCHRSNECFLSSKKCDGKRDCKFGEDEENCLPHVTENSICRYDQKLCHNVCIGKNEICEESTQKVSVTCSPTEELCDDSSMCIDRSSLCNGIFDCPDGSDELPGACNTLTCLESEFMCSSGYCIPSSWRCDKALDCADGSDEINCASDKTCPEAFHQCGDSTCIKLLKRCDGHFDCSDASDEDNCDMPELIVTEFIPMCHQWEFSCEHNESICLPLTARCNGKVECPGGSDEIGCDFHCAPKGLYPCKQEMICLTKRQMCNGRNDCTDGSDETIEACEKVNKSISFKKINFQTTACYNGFRCANGQCIEWNQVCNNVTNCHDGSDEKGNCSTPCDKCPGFCQSTPLGPVCVCPLGYTKNGDNCEDVDECLTDVCSHVCRNKPGSFVCTCYPGYELRSDRRSCKALSGVATILYTKDNSIWSVIAHHHFLEHTYSQDKTISSLDYDIRNKKLYIAVTDNGEIIEINKSFKVTHTTAISNIGRPTEVSIDWITGNIYFVDTRSAASNIRVCNFNTRTCARLQKLSPNVKVSSLVVDPVNNQMFYCIAQSHGSVIRSASLAGTNITDVASVPNCTGLALDSYAEKVYVLDSPGALWKVDYDGHNMVSILKNNAYITRPHSPTIFEDHIYFLDNNTLSRCLLFGPKTCEIYLYINATSFIIRHESLQREVPNICPYIDCTNVCLNQVGVVCICPDGTLTDGTCPNTKDIEVPLINGKIHLDTASPYTVPFTLIMVVLVVFSIYLCVFMHYQIVKHCKKRRENYMQVRYENRPDAVTEFTTSIIEVPTAGGINHEFVNPLQYVRNIWNDSFLRSKPIGTANLTFDTQQNISDTESDIDINENKNLLRGRC